MNEQVNKWVNGTGSCNEIKVERNLQRSKEGELFFAVVKEGSWGEGRIVVVVFYKLNKRREAPGGRKINGMFSAGVNWRIENFSEIAGYGWKSYEMWLGR